MNPGIARTASPLQDGTSGPGERPGRGTCADGMNPMTNSSPRTAAAIPMRLPTSISTRALALATCILVAACGQGEPSGPGAAATATVSGVVRAASGAVIQGASVSVGSAAATTGADGRFEIRDLSVGSATIAASAPRFNPRSESVSLAEGANTHDLVLTPQPLATLSGVVTASSGAVVPGASVSVGGATATTGADGRFAFQDLPAGSATMTTSAPGFDPRSESVGLAEGANTRDVVLTPQTLFTYQNAVAYLPPGIGEYRVAIVFLPGLRDPATGNPLDSRGLVRGTPDGTCSIWCPGQIAQVRTRALGLAGGDVALIGTTTLLDNSAGYATLLQALAELGTQSAHPELADIPIFFVGHSQGGCTAYGFSRVHGARVAGFLTMKGGCHNPGPAQAAAGVPGHFLIGAQDEPHRRDNITGVFEAGRAAGAPWALSTDPYQHGPIVDFDLMFDWIDAVLTARLPLTPGAPLRPVTETSGWLGDRSSGTIATYACYGSTRSSASWLPTQETALDWQRMAGGAVVVGAC
jgi:pimeloyl-ACP methyl ester carboxylesterase